MAGHELPGKHGDSIDYDMLNTFLISFAAGIVLGIVLIVAL
ncbi:hypothetical protein AAIA72_08480 [Hahella sp. SMD15-11]|uniref:Uncharacterized protein n=1 Tax=Thermohahella caldifontis TaxID=3142973 RepID=A0AB39USB4_9GAMM